MKSPHHKDKDRDWNNSISKTNFEKTWNPPCKEIPNKNKKRAYILTKKIFQSQQNLTELKNLFNVGYPSLLKYQILQILCNPGDKRTLL